MPIHDTPGNKWGRKSINRTSHSFASKVNKKTFSIYRLINAFIVFCVQLPEAEHMKKTRFTVSQAQEGFFLNVASRGLSDATKRDYENTTNKFITFVGAEKPIDTVTVHDIEGFLAVNNHLSKKTLLN
jgi:hypothetical protein